MRRGNKERCERPRVKAVIHGRTQRTGPACPSNASIQDWGWVQAGKQEATVACSKLLASVAKEGMLYSVKMSPAGTVGWAGVAVLPKRA